MKANCFKWGYIMFVIMAVLSSCSKEDVKENDLVGTWVGIFDEEETTFVFNSNGTLTRTSTDDKIGVETYTNNKYYVDGNSLRIDFNIENGIVDDYTIGTYSIKNNTFTYVFTWHDGQGAWDHEDEETCVMTKK